MKESKWNIENIPNQSGRKIIITGATSGLGKEAARILSKKNASVIMAIRNVQKGEKVKNSILKEYPNADIIIRKLDLTSLSSVKNFSKKILQENDQLDMLINNAGIMAPPYSTTQDGFEIQMGTNHLGHFALTGHLMPLLQETKAARIVALSSIAHLQGNIDFSDFNWEKRKYNSSKAYSDSKIANLYFIYELAKRAENKSNFPIVAAAHPGWTKTDLQRHSIFFRVLNPIFSQGVEMGVLPTLRAAFDPNVQSGDYYGPKGFMEMKGYPVKVKSNRRSYDTEAAKTLWNISEELTGIKY